MVDRRTRVSKESSCRTTSRRQMEVALAGELDCLGFATRLRRRFRNVAPSERVSGNFNGVASSSSWTTPISAVTPLLLKSPSLGALTPPERRIKRSALRAGCAYFIFSKETGVFQQFAKTHPASPEKSDGRKGQL